MSHEIDQEPVAYVGLADDHLDALAFDPTIAHPENECPNVRAEHYGDTVNLKDTLTFNRAANRYMNGDD